MFHRLSRPLGEMTDTDLHTFMFADISGYSRLAERHGDEVAADVALTFLATVSRLAPEHDAEVVKCLGDGVMVRGSDAREMIRLAVAVLADCEEQDLFPPIHVGLHTGGALRRSGDWWGATVNLAARVATAAGPGELLITEATRTAAGEHVPTGLRALGRLHLKNITTPVRVHAAVRAPAMALAAAGP
jgi:adenylate cyclase